MNYIILKNILENILVRIDWRPIEEKPLNISNIQSRKVKNKYKMISYRDEHASAFEPTAAASEESHREDDESNSNGQSIDIEELILRQKSGVLRIGQTQPDAKAYDAASRQLQTQTQDRLLSCSGMN